MKRVYLVSLPGLVQEATRAALMSLEDVTLVGTTSGALSATVLLPQGQPDLLLVDANLPEKEVEALVRWTRQHYPGLPCVVMTLTSQQRYLALSWGANAAIQRGRLFGQLETTLRQLLPFHVPDGPSSPDSSWQPSLDLVTEYVGQTRQGVVILPLVADTARRIYDNIQRICKLKNLDTASGCHVTLIGAHIVEQDKRLLIISELARISVTEHATETIL